MTREEAIKKQAEIAEHYRLEWWFGTDCEKCCGVYPRLLTEVRGPGSGCRYECDVCGKTTKEVPFPFDATKEWNAGKFVEKQIRFC